VDVVEQDGRKFGAIVRVFLYFAPHIHIGPVFGWR
jgi:hypothetical protein